MTAARDAAATGYVTTDGLRVRGNYRRQPITRIIRRPGRTTNPPPRPRRSDGGVGAWQRRTAARATEPTTQSRFGETMRDNPMAVGAVALAAGAVIGTLMPRTDVEDTYLGETRDTVVDSAREIAEDKVQELSNIVRDSSDTAVNGRETSPPSFS